MWNYGAYSRCLNILKESFCTSLNPKIHVEFTMSTIGSYPETVLTSEQKKQASPTDINILPTSVRILINTVTFGV